MNRVHFNINNNTFVVNETVEFKPVLCVTDEYPPDRFSLTLLHNERPDFGENCIFEVYVKPENERVGWIFPRQALFSNQHDFAENRFFLKYAFVAYYKLLEMNENLCEEEIPNQVLLLIDYENAANVPGFDLDDYTASLFSYGYSFSGNGNLLPFFIDYSTKKIRLKPLAKSIDTKKAYIQELFKTHLPKASDSISTFVLLYQIIEILISIVFDESFHNLLDEINASENVDLMLKKEKLIESTSEKKRLNILFSNKASVSSENLNALGDSCVNLLSKYKQEIFESIPDRLYSVRCLLVHRCYIFDSEGIELIKSINNAFVFVVVDLLTSFK